MMNIISKLEECVVVWFNVESIFGYGHGLCCYIVLSMSILSSCVHILSPIATKLGGNYNNSNYGVAFTPVNGMRPIGDG